MKHEINSTERRYDLDWLRVIAFGILIYFHAAVAFLPQGLPMILNAQSSEELGIMANFLHQFRLALLFFVSGCGVCFALKTRDRRAFMRERSFRLIIPLVFGIVALVPIMVYLEKRYLGVGYSSFLHFYSEYFTQGAYPSGNLSWHHFWFLAYLYLFCLLGWPIFNWSRSTLGRANIDGYIERFQLDQHGLYLLIIPLLIVEIVLRPMFPGFRDLIHDWASFMHWFMIFLIGFFFAYDRRLLTAAENLRLRSLLVACTTTLLLFAKFWRPEEAHLYPFEGDQIDVLDYFLFCALRIANAWCWILVCVGYAAHYLNRPSKILQELNRAVYPVFCLHLPVLVVLEFYILPTNWSVSTKFLLISNLALVALVIIYLLIRPLKIIHPLVGLKTDKMPSAIGGRFARATKTK